MGDMYRKRESEEEIYRKRMLYKKI